MPALTASGCVCVQLKKLTGDDGDDGDDGDQEVLVPRLATPTSLSTASSARCLATPTSLSLATPTRLSTASSSSRDTCCAPSSSARRLPLAYTIAY